MGGSRVEVRLPALPESLDVVQDLVARLWEHDPGVAAQDRFRFEMAVVEIFGNIVQHTVQTDSGPPVRTVECVLSCDETDVVGEFADDGRPAAIDLSTVTMPEPDAESGRGLALALAAVDDLQYARDADVNRWTITCHRSA